KGTVTNASSQVLLQPAVVLGSTVASLEDLPPGASAAVDVGLQPALMGQPISDRVVGQLFFDGSEIGEEGARKSARHTIVDQLTYDPNSGFTSQLPSDGAVILAWSDQSLMPIEISGQVPKRTGNILYFLPAELAVRGRTTFGNDLLRSTVVSADSAEISKDTSNLYFGKGSIELSYRPIAFQGTIEATQLTIGLNTGEGPGLIAKPTMVKPLDSTKPSCEDAPGGCQGNVDGLPEVEFYDQTSSAWRQLPHLGSGIQYALEEPQRYVDGASGTVRVRFVNDRSEGVGFQLNLAITGDLK
ncbi:MAG: hypothetical protein H0U58_09680, partial [Chloroflexi bacterium]|nr:hypothetical protein [Chloroflexota bacterium]